MAPEMNVKFDQPAFYWITVQGEINDKLIAILEGIGTEIESEGEITRTNLKVFVKDQARLSGILNTLYDNRYCIIRVLCIDKLP